MKERPILFSAPMVRALLAGTKTQTRRLVKPQPPFGCRYLINGANNAALCQSLDNPAVWVPPTPSSVDHRLPCPYGQPGDCLWVKETHRFDGLDPKFAIANRDAESVQFFADEADATVAWRPSIFMHRWASRLTLEITEIRVERLQSISEADAEAEGVTPASRDHTAAAVAYIFGAKEFQAHKSAYATLWEQLNGAGSWALNPWVWVVSFKRVEA